MPTSFPGSLDNFVNPLGTDDVSVVDHAGQHSDVNDAVEALEAKVGINGSAVTSSHDYKIAQLDTNKVPYTGATNDVDMGVFSVNAESFLVTGSAGAGHVHLKHQSIDATATGSSTALFADVNGDLKYKNDGAYYTTFVTSSNTANRAYTFPDVSGPVGVGGSSITIAGTAASLGGSISLDTITGLSSTGLIKRSGTNTLAIAVAGTDYLNFSGLQKITVGTTAPASPATGDLWVDTN